MLILLSCSCSIHRHMELLFLSLLLFPAVFISIYLNFFYKYKSKTLIHNAKLPPGNMGWPIIGESLEFYRNGLRGTPEKFFKDRMQKFSSEVFTTSLFGESTAVLCGAMGNKFLFTNENKLVNVWWPSSVDKVIPNSLSSSSITDDSLKFRNRIRSFLKPEALQRYIGIMDVIAKRHLETNWDNHKEVIVLHLAKNYTLSVSCRLFMSMDDPDQFEKFANTFNTIVVGLMSLPIDLPGTPFYRAIKASKLIRKEICQVVKQRKIDLAEKKASPTQDILSHLLLTSDENGKFMNEIDIAGQILGLIIGNDDTTSATITFVIKYLAELPQIYVRVLKEQMEIAAHKGPGEMLNWDDIQKMKYSWNVVCEVLRLVPPLLGTFREAITDFTYSGFSIPKGLKLYWSSRSTHGNPKNFPDPEVFNPSRFEGNGPAPYTYVPFGGGPRMCPGKEFARLEILVFLHNVARKYKWEKLLSNEKTIYNPFAAPAKGLPVKLQPLNMQLSQSYSLFA